MNDVNNSAASHLAVNFDKFNDIISSLHLSHDSGKVTEVTGMLIRGYLPGATIGGIVHITPMGTEKSFLAEVVGFKDKYVLMMPLGDMKGIGLGSKIVLSRQMATVRVSNELLGRIVDGLGRPIDNHLEIEDFREVPLYSEPRNPLMRKPIREAMDLGVRAINASVTLGKGQRVSIMAGSGVGKSVLLGMMARYAKADINVIAMIGERGREVREFVENDLGPDGMAKSIVVCVTSDQSPLLRMRGAYVATAIAEYFSSQGKDVLLMMDSITRFAMAQREIGLSTGEPPSSKGYTPSVFSLLPRLLERAGNFENEGSITGLYTTLVEGDDMNDPIGDAVRSIVDGHIVLSRQMAQRGHFPAVDILQSSSRVMKNVTQPEHIKLAQKIRETLAVYREAEDLINIGAYKPGSNPKIDKAIKLIEPVNDFLRQDITDPTDMTQCLRRMQQIFINS
jgi:flagellum-specific ATP synthase